MSQDANNPPTDKPPAETGRALRYARIGIALGLLIGVGVFGVFAIIDLSQPPGPTAKNNDFGKATGAPEPSRAFSPENLSDLGRLDPNNFIPIEREMPHPGQIDPYLEAASLKQPPYHYPITDGVVVETAAYSTDLGDVDDAIAHYSAKAQRRGLKSVRVRPTSERAPGGVAGVWSDGTDTLRVTIWQAPQPPPRRPRVEWVVEYSYPAPFRDGQRKNR